MATKIIKAWINGSIQEIEVEDIVSPEQPLSVEERLDILEDKPIITDGNFLVGNGTKDMEEISPDEVLEHINGATIVTMTTEEYEALEETNANALYMLTDSEEEDYVLTSDFEVLQNMVNTLDADKLDASELPTAIDTALAQAKASGEFDGADGQDGTDGYTPVRGTDYWTDADKAEIKAYVDEAILGGEW